MKFIKSIAFVFALTIFTPNFGSSPKSGGKSLFSSQQKSNAESASGIFALIAQAPQVANSGAVAASAATVSACANVANHHEQVDLKAQEEHEIEEIAHKFQMEKTYAQSFLALKKKTAQFESNQPVDLDEFYQEYWNLNIHAGKKGGRGLGERYAPKELLQAVDGFLSTYFDMKSVKELSKKYKVTISPQS
jgi:hypothetical protein